MIIGIFLSTNILILQSHPLWMRGLKSPQKGHGFNSFMSHPLWMRGLKSIESLTESMTESRILYGCVD